ncbi:Pkinase-domain-containing protein [Butyriboletus roseoflavus]|nr:Pkinase-domain-containing protein [Butyriboletus roseoflavus]
MTSQHRSTLKSHPIPFVLSSRGAESSTTSHPSPHHDAPESSQTTFRQRIRSSFEHGLKTATRSKVKVSAPNDDFETISAKQKDNDNSTSDDSDKGRSGMFKRLESKVGLRRAGRNSVTPSSTPTVSSADQTRVSTEHVNNAERHGQPRVAGWTSFITPSLRQASVSSPAIHLSSLPIPSPNPHQIVIIDPTLNPATDSIARDRTCRASMQPTVRDISAPQPLAPRREHRSSVGTPERNGTASPRAGKSRPSPIFTPSLPSARSSIDTPRTSSDLPSLPDSPSPQPGGRGRLGTVARRPGATLNSPPASPTPKRAASPGHVRTQTRRVTPTSYHGLVSASAIHLPSSPPIHLTANKRLSVDTPRPSIDSSRRSSAEISHRSSTDTPRRSSMDTQRRLTASPSRPTSPSTARPRGTSPAQKLPGYVHNRNFNTSAASLNSPSTPEQRELVRAATSLLCKELRKPPPHLSRSEHAREWAEVEVRLQPLVRLERIWGKSGALPGASSSQVGVTGLSSSVVSNAGEERERKLFCEALRDGVVLCQLMNKHVPSAILRIDPREDGFKRTSNITKFLAACSSHGVPSDDLFYRDDLIETSPETLCRVARTIISFLKLSDTLAVDRSKVIHGQGNRDVASNNSFYSPPILSRAASSTPNLIQQRSVSPPPTSGRKYLASPELALPPLRSDSPHSGTSCGTAGNVSMPVGNLENDDVPSMKLITPTPKSPLRTRYDDSGSGLPPDPNSLDFPTRDSQSSIPMGDYGHDFPLRQSRTSSNITENTAYSSIFDLRRNSSAQNKFGTVRTATTEATSLGSEVPSITRTEASSVAASLAEEMARRRINGDASRARDRRPSESATPDLVSLLEEEENSACGSSSRETARARSPVDDGGQRDHEAEQVRVRLGKGKWPDDFMGAFQASPPRSIPIQTKTIRGESPLGFGPSSASPPRKPYLMGVSRHNDGTDSVPSSPRRPTHRPRHSVDPVLMPKESILRRDASPDSPIPGSPGSKVILRRSSTRNGARRNAIYVPRGTLDDPDREGSSSAVPFPRAVSGEHSTRASPSPDSLQSPVNLPDASRIRGRLYSEFDDPKAKQRSRPSSYDELGRSRRSSDLPGRESMDGGTGRQTIVVEEEGKAPVRFQLGNCIGRGQFGIVYRALNLNTGQMVAVKRIRLEGLKEEEVMQLMKEVDLMKSLSHPGIVKYEGMVRDEEFLNIVLEYAESGSLGQTLKAFGKLNEHLVASYVVKILEGLYYLHKCEVVHCDLKAANILTTKTGNIKLSDFGVSLNLRAMERELNSVAGTPNWMAPEVIELKGASPKSDIWSLGCTVIELLTGRPPYGEIANTMTVMFRIVEDEMPPLPDDRSEALEDFLQQCFHKDPLRRPDAESLCEHPWLKMNWDALKELRPQDSIPFLRRVSADLQKTDAAKVLAQINSPIMEAPSSEPPMAEEPSVPQQNVPFGPASPLPDDTPVPPRNHTFVKTIFGKSMICRVCLGSVKKNGVICDRCSLIAHAKCAQDAAPSCDLRSQLLLYAQFAENSNSNGLHQSHDGANTSPLPVHASVVVPSEVSFATPSLRPSADLTSSTPNSTQALPTKPAAAFKFISGFGRSRSSLSVSQPSALPSPILVGNTEDKAPERKTSKLKHNVNSAERPQSESSNSTGPRSVNTMDSQSSRREPRRSFFSIGEPDTESVRRANQHASEGASSSKITSNGGSAFEMVQQDIPGALPGGSDSQKKRNSGRHSNCVLQ